jgi:hypothetical protein
MMASYLPVAEGNQLSRILIHITALETDKIGVLYYNTPVILPKYHFAARGYVERLAHLVRYGNLTT